MNRRDLTGITGQKNNHKLKIMKDSFKEIGNVQKYQKFAIKFANAVFVLVALF